MFYLEVDFLGSYETEDKESILGYLHFASALLTLPSHAQGKICVLADKLLLSLTFYLKSII